MKDRSKVLAVINTGKRRESSELPTKQIIKGGSGGSTPSGMYLLKSIWDKCWEIKTTEQGEEYIFGKLPVILQSGLTSFADTGDVDLPSLYDGLVIDNETIIWDEVTEEVTDEEGNVTTKVVKVLKAKGGGSGEGTIKDIVVNGNGNALTAVGLSSDKTGLVFTKGMTFAERSYVDKTFVTLDTYQSISGGKNFTGGLFVNGGEIKYNGSYWQLDGDLLVTGGITAFADRYSSTSIMDAIVTDEQTITVEDINGVKTLKVIGGGSGGGVDEEVVKDIIDSYLTGDKLPVASTSYKGIASFDSKSFNVSSGHVTFNGGKVKVVTSTPSTYESNTLYVIVG